MAGDTFIFGGETLTSSNLAQHSSETKSVISSTVHSFDDTVAAEDGIHDRATLLFFALQELKEICVSWVTQDNPIFIVAVKVCSRITLNVLGQTDWFKDTDIIRMFRKEHVLISFKELLGILGIERCDHAQK